MEILETELPGVKLIQPRLFGDDRGFFLEMYHQQKFNEGGIPEVFVQDNLSRSQRGVLRGLHYQIKHPQGKLVTVMAGEIFDVAVDMRRSSPHFGKWIGKTLSAENRCSLYIPPGFAHGFYVRSESADVFYKCTDLYHPEYERTLLWNDTAVGIDWTVTIPPLLSEKDAAGLSISAVECYE